MFGLQRILFPIDDFHFLSIGKTVIPCSCLVPFFPPNLLHFKIQVRKVILIRELFAFFEQQAQWIMFEDIPDFRHNNIIKAFLCVL